MNRKSIFLMTALMFLVLSAQLFAVGTRAGTVISNVAYGGYSDANSNVIADVDDDTPGSPTERVASNTVTTTVATVYGVDVQSDQSLDISRSSSVLYSMTVTNTGNFDDQFDLSAITVSGGASSFTTTVYSDGGTIGVIDGTDAPITETPVMADNAVYNILVLVELDAAEGARSEVGTTTVTATSQNDPAPSPADDSGTLTSTVQAADLAGTLAPDATSKAPGATITYTLTLNNGSGANTETAYDVSPALTLPANCSWVGNVTVGGSGVPNPGAGGTVNVGNLAPGASIVVTYQVQVNAGVPSGTTIDNQVDVAHDDSQAEAYTPLSTYANAGTGGRVTVSETNSFTTDITPASQSGDPGDVVRYLVTVNNTGNGTDSYEITNESSSEGWTWTFYIDNDDNGVWNGTEPLATNTGNVPSGGSQAIWAVATIPAGTADETEDTSVFRYTSDENNLLTSDETGTTTVTAPILTLLKAVDPPGAQVPGTLLTYSVEITNSGTGDATNVVVRDAIPANTTYETGTLEIDGAGQTDASDTDDAECDGTNALFEVGNVAAGATVTVEFQVEID